MKYGSFCKNDKDKEVYVVLNYQIIMILVHLCILSIVRPYQFLSKIEFQNYKSLFSSHLNDIHVVLNYRPYLKDIGTLMHPINCTSLSINK